MIQAGEMLGNYEVAAHLTGGGMASIYIARRRDDPNATPVAIKVIHPHLSKEWEAIRMFIDEATLSVRIRHPNVVRVDELGETNGTYFLAMEYVHGATLAKLLGKMGLLGRRLAPELAVWIASEVAAGLHAAHETVGNDGENLNVIHRDVSPQNILLSHDGRVKLVDFGIAKSSGRAERTRHGVIKGKFRYLAPEQAFSQPLDRRVDVYALGVVLWEMLTMRRMWGNLDAIQLLGEIRSGRMIPPSEFTPSLSKNIEAVVMKALSRDAADRFATTAEMRQALLATIPRSQVTHRDLSQVLLGFVEEELMEAARKLPKKIARETGVPLPPSQVISGDAFMESDRSESTTLWTRTAERATIDPEAMDFDEDDLIEDATDPENHPSGALHVIGRKLDAKASTAPTILNMNQGDVEEFRRALAAAAPSSAPSVTPAAAISATPSDYFEHPEPPAEESGWGGFVILVVLALIAFAIGAGAALMLLE